MKIVGTGLPRTGTNSLKVAIEQLIEAPCYHMYECIPRADEHAPQWTAIADGGATDWSFLDDFAAIVDWPGSAVWERLVADFPDAVVVHSVRDDAAQWWKSVDSTVGQAMRRALAEAPGSALPDMIRALIARVGWGTVDDPEAMMTQYDEHNRRVRATVEPERLVVINPRDGWAPLCAALGVPVPDEPYPRTNSTEDYEAAIRAAAQRDDQ
ncbi:MAG: sulfotransferase family protein [Actinomycetota bacterium]